jgi:hypothetical protein
LTQFASALHCFYNLAFCVYVLQCVKLYNRNLQISLLWYHAPVLLAALTFLGINFFLLGNTGLAWEQRTLVQAAYGYILIYFVLSQYSICFIRKNFSNVFPLLKHFIKYMKYTGLIQLIVAAAWLYLDFHREADQQNLAYDLVTDFGNGAKVLAVFLLA